MRIAAVEEKLKQLQADQEAISWSGRVELVQNLCGSSNRIRAFHPSILDLLRLLASDPKWEVRKEVADHLHKLGESDFAALASILAHDENAFVKTSAERALARRRKGHAGDAKRAKGLDRMEGELGKLEALHGSKVSSLVRDLAHRLYEGLVGASVHEMRSIVTAMKSNVELLEQAAETDVESVARKVAPRLARQVSFLEQLLSDMRDYTHSPSRSRGTERLQDLVTEALEMVREEFRAKRRDASQISVIQNIPADLMVTVSRVEIVLALRNLLKNAHEAFIIDDTQFSGGEIHLDATGGEDGIRIEIRDNGMGLSEGELEAVCEFIPGRTSKNYLGTGFGLPIAQRNLKANGGDLRIESWEDQGTTVTVWLPMAGENKK